MSETPTSPCRSVSHSRWWRHLPLLLLLVTELPLIWYWGSYSIGGSRYFCLSDDAMISMRYARNLAEGNGLVWNVGERVEGYSNLGWTLVMAGVHLLPIPERLTSLAVMLLAVGLNAACLVALGALVARLGGNALTVFAAQALYAVSLYPLFWALAGMETTLLTLAVLAALVLILQDARAGRLRPLTAIVIGLPAVIRADGIAPTVLLVAFLLWQLRPTARSAGLLALTFAPFVLSVVFRLAYYGELAPNTSYLKMYPGRLAAGGHWVGDFVRSQAAFIVVILTSQVCGRFRRRGVVALLALCTGYTLVVLWEGGDAWPWGRLLVPVIPLLIASAALGVEDLLASGPRETALRPAVAAFYTALALIPAMLLTPHLRPERVAALRWKERPAANVAAGLAIARNTRPETRIACFWAGATPYFAHRYTVDLLGKCDAHIAHELPRGSSGRPGHNKFDYDWSLGVLRPDLIVSNYTQTEAAEALRQVAAGGEAGDYNSALYAHPVFRELYLPNTVLPGALSDPPCIYLRGDSPELARATVWK